MHAAVDMSDDPNESGPFRSIFQLVVQVPESTSVDGYLFWEAGEMRLRVQVYEMLRDSSSLSGGDGVHQNPSLNALIDRMLAMGAQQATSREIVDGVGLFGTEFYMRNSDMHSGKTSSFKRCVFMKAQDLPAVCHLMKGAPKSHEPSYIHLLHAGGGAVKKMLQESTTFGCRDWDHACIVTGVWPRHEGGRQAAHDVVDWVYDVVKSLLPRSCGVYGADLGPDPRDASMAQTAFGGNRPKLATMKQPFDPQNVLAFACRQSWSF
jgi:hypothetical protein